MKNFLYVCLFVLLSILSLGDTFKDNEKLGKELSDTILLEAITVTNSDKLAAFKKSSKKGLKNKVFKNLNSSLKKDFYQKINLKNIAKESEIFCSTINHYLIVDQNVEKLIFLKEDFLKEQENLLKFSFKDRKKFLEKNINLISEIRKLKNFSKINFEKYPDVDFSQNDDNMTVIIQSILIEKLYDDTISIIIKNHQHLLSYNVDDKIKSPKK